ncbi:4'-phosphopantetheinyl transferase superfamily protein [Desulfopila sp. IMCC35008]|uniref:4'-phosphopantetheinyl transferase superfamily protein n=1 Tax=Desulfopila sp. IMCC35008 TaxID=2653858 RepID=UPI0013D845BE|nr:4'-phosphopantetheinyl transferase superfamily protein [Desulfopila sp. IMCC35008]
MFINIFPKSLNLLIRQTYLHHRLQTAMLPIVTIAEYNDKAAKASPERKALGDTELNKATHYQVAKRQNEWLTGRLAVKMATMHYLPDTLSAQLQVEPHQFTVENSDSGRPYLTGNLPEDLQKTDISLSHGNGYGAAIIADTPCGIDIESCRESLKKVRHKFCTAEEEETLLHQLGELSDLQQLTILWTAKEAAKKSLSHLHMPGFLDLMLISMEPHMTGWVLNFMISSRNFDQFPPTISVVSELYEGFGISICLMGDHNNA